MEELFQNTAVDGSTSCIPRLSNFDAPGDVEDEEVDNEEGFQMSPPSSNSSHKSQAALHIYWYRPKQRTPSSQKCSSGSHYAG